jgi:hypothetical protein
MIFFGHRPLNNLKYGREEFESQALPACTVIRTSMGFSEESLSSGGDVRDTIQGI